MAKHIKNFVAHFETLRSCRRFKFSAVLVLKPTKLRPSAKKRKICHWEDTADSFSAQ